MGGKLSSSGHAKNALVQLTVYTLPGYLSQNNFAGPTAVGAGQKQLKENPGWARVLSGKFHDRRTL